MMNLFACSSLDSLDHEELCNAIAALPAHRRALGHGNNVESGNDPVEPHGI